MTKGEQIYRLMEELFPICRSITGDGVRQTFQKLKEICPSLKTYEIPTGTKVFDWEIPKEWNIRDAYVEDSQGRRVIDFRENNLHVVGYSLPMDKTISLPELKKMIHTYPKLPDAVPYVTSYYKEASGFCMSQNRMNELEDGNYHAVIDSELKDGSLTYGDILIPGESEQEILFSTYICHPSMANNELSGPCTAIYLAQHLARTAHKYTYRFVFVPETIGSIAYINRNFDQLKKNVAAGYNLSCLGDDRTYTCVSPDMAIHCLTGRQNWFSDTDSPNITTIRFSTGDLMRDNIICREWISLYADSTGRNPMNMNNTIPHWIIWTSYLPGLLVIVSNFCWIWSLFWNIMLFIKIFVYANHSWAKEVFTQKRAAEAVQKQMEHLKSSIFWHMQTGQMI